MSLYPNLAEFQFSSVIDLTQTYSVNRKSNSTEPKHSANYSLRFGRTIEHRTLGRSNYYIYISVNWKLKLTIDWNLDILMAEQ